MAHDLDDDVGAWLALAAQGAIGHEGDGSRWRWWFDAHARFFDDSDGFEQSILRPGLGYDLSSRSTVWLGYGWINTHPANVANIDEHRIWQQYTWGIPLEVGKFSSRTRLEQRFVERGDDVGWRLRQFVRWTRPLQSDPGLGLRLWDEVFFNLNDTDWGADTGFAQNRLFAGFGWSFRGTQSYTLEFGYLNQYIPRDSADDAMGHVLSCTLLLRL